MRWHEGHKWYYMADQKPDECLFIKIYDSEEGDGTARATAHSAFHDPSSPKDAPQRQSIEVRCMVFEAE